jgi:hypothetical protein
LIGNALRVSQRTVERWRLTPAYQRYADLLVRDAIKVNIRQARSTAARNLPEVMKVASALAIGKGRKGTPRHPYQVHAGRLVMEGAGLMNRPGSMEAALEVPTDAGPIRIVFRSTAQHEEG